MCGITGCVGNTDCVRDVLSGLSFLEYRGYDSSGVAVLQDGKINIVKKKGRVSVLEKELGKNPIKGSPCIGHTRWATHGAAEDRNAHPFMSNDGAFALVHNGIIENYLEIKTMLAKAGFVFSSETDSEVIVDLIQLCNNGNTLLAISEAVNMLKGSFAFALVSTADCNKIFFAKKDNPLLVGVKNGVGYVCSDYYGLSSRLDKCASLADETLGFVTPDGVALFDFMLNEIQPEYCEVTGEARLSLGKYAHYMRKEIDEIPEAVSKALNSYYLSFNKSSFEGVKRMVFIGCGTAFHAGMVAKRLLRELVPTLDCYAETSGEFIYSSFPTEETLVIAISQSGETADTLCAVKKTKKNGGRVIAVCNVPASSIVREADETVLTAAGTEIAVASTKAYNCQLAVLTAFCLDAADYFSARKDFCEGNTVCELLSLPTKLKAVLSCEKEIAEIARLGLNAKVVFYLGRGLDYCVAKEGSLKLKEISYVNSDAYAAGELKHGTLALIEDGVLVIAIVTQKYLLDKMATCLAEVRARGARVVVITPFAEEKLTSQADKTVFIPETCELLSPMLSVVPTQLFAYYSALYRGADIDKPRNLAKSVTVH